MSNNDEQHVITRSLAEQLLNYIVTVPTGPHSLATANGLLQQLRQLPRLQDAVPPPEPPP